MARADLTPPKATQADEPIADAVDLLTRDHRLVEELFTAFEQAKPQQMDPLGRRLCKLVRIHAQIEEEIFYPAARRAVQDEAIIDHAERDHEDARQAIARVESMTSNDDGFRDAVLTLADLVRAHVREEEGDLFPELRKSTLNLSGIGLTLAERRAALLETLGLHSDDEEGALNQRNVQESTARTQPGRS